MARKKRREKSGAATLDLTPMIDVVFQLLIFFVVTLKPIDVIGQLDVFRPAPDPQARPEQKLDDMIRITVLQNHRFMLNQRSMSLAIMRKNLEMAAARSKTQTILIQCSELSVHNSLVAVLDLCAEVGLTNISVFTLPTGRPG
jgi:biopolymer transport protein ExbD